MSLLKILAIVATHGYIPIGYGARMAVNAVSKLCPIDPEQYPGYEVEDGVDDELYDHTFRHDEQATHSG